MHDFFAEIEAAICEAEGMSHHVEHHADESRIESRRDSRGAGTLTPGNGPLPQLSEVEITQGGRGRVVLIEGMDLAGKSTLVRNLQVELTNRGIRVRISRNALCADNPIAPIADELRRDSYAGLLETGALFLASHLWDARHFVPPPPGTIHIQDSCWLRTLAYHTVRGTPQVPALLRRAMPTFPQFDSAIFVTAALSERRRRLQKRERDQPGANDHGDHAVARDPRLFCNLDSSLWRCARRLAGAARIDTTRVTEKALVLRVIQIIDSCPQQRDAMK